MNAAEPLIQLHNLEKSYEAGSGRFFVLRRITLDIAPGEFVTIMGPSGAGKSTLLSIIGMLDGAWQGEYFFLGQPVHAMKVKQRNELHKTNIGFVFQSYHLIDDLTVFENLDLPLSPPLLARVRVLSATSVSWPALAERRARLSFAPSR